MRKRSRLISVACIISIYCVIGFAECSRGAGVFLAWDGLLKATNVPAGQGFARFVFGFTNSSVTNVTILNVKPSCGCTTVQLPKLPWVIPAGASGQIGVSVNLAGKSGTLIKTVKVSTDKNTDTLMAQITIVPSPNKSDAQRLENMKMAAANRQAVFAGDCASCHVVPGEGKNGQALYDAVCGICHEGKDRASMVPDLHHLKVPTDADFWRVWISYGKAGTLMPAFSMQQGGPLSEPQINSLTNYLVTVISPKKVTALPSRPPP